MKNGPTIYFTGDTAFNNLLAEAVRPHKPDVIVVVINGAFRNLGPAEAALLAKQLGVKRVVPCHHDLFEDNCQPPQMLHTNLKLMGIGSTAETRGSKNSDACVLWKNVKNQSSSAMFPNVLPYVFQNRFGSRQGG